MIASATARRRVAAFPSVDAKAIWHIARWLLVAVWVAGMTDDCPGIEAAAQPAAVHASFHAAQTPGPLVGRR